MYAVLNTKKLKPEPEKFMIRSYKNYLPENFNHDLKQALEDPQLKEMLEAEQLDAATEQLVKIFLNTAEQHAPVKEITINENKQHIPWATPELEELMAERSNRRQLHWLDGYLSDLKIIKSLSNKINHLKRKLKRTFYRDKIQEHADEPKKMWNILKEITQTNIKQQHIEPEFLDQNMADNFNNHFATIGTKIQNTLNNEEKQPKQAEPETEKGNFKFKAESEETIIKLIERIRTDVAVGHDNLNAKSLKDTKYTISNILTKLVNLGYKQSKFPNCMKKAIVRALHKKDTTEDPMNYRPLSILSVLSKVFERSATDQLISYLEKNELLNETQHAYRKNHSTHTCLSDTVNYIYQEIDKGNLVGIASLDLSKAFDTINHRQLLQKLRKLGIGRNSINWCESYLTGRKQHDSRSTYRRKKQLQLAFHKEVF